MKVIILIRAFSAHFHFQIQIYYKNAYTPKKILKNFKLNYKPIMIRSKHL